MRRIWLGAGREGTAIEGYRCCGGGAVNEDIYDADPEFRYLALSLTVKNRSSSAVGIGRWPGEGQSRGVCLSKRGYGGEVVDAFTVNKHVCQHGSRGREMVRIITARRRRHCRHCQGKREL